MNAAIKIRDQLRPSSAGELQTSGAFFGVKRVHRRRLVLTLQQDWGLLPGASDCSYGRSRLSAEVDRRVGRFALDHCCTWMISSGLCNCWNAVDCARHRARHLPLRLAGSAVCVAKIWSRSRIWFGSPNQKAAAIKTAAFAISCAWGWGCFPFALFTSSKRRERCVDSRTENGWISSCASP